MHEREIETEIFEGDICLTPSIVGSKHMGNIPEEHGHDDRIDIGRSHIL